MKIKNKMDIFRKNNLKNRKKIHLWIKYKKP